MAFALPVFNIERLAGVMPTLSDSSPNDIFQRAIMTSRFTTIMFKIVEYLFLFDVQIKSFFMNIQNKLLKSDKNLF